MIYYLLEDGMLKLYHISSSCTWPCCGAKCCRLICRPNSAAAGCHAGGNALNAGVGGQFDGDDIPAHFGTALTLFIKQAAAALDPPCLELGNDHKNAPLVDRVKGIGCLITGTLLRGKKSLTEMRQ